MYLKVKHEFVSKLAQVCLIDLCLCVCVGCQLHGEVLCWGWLVFSDLAICMADVAKLGAAVRAAGANFMLLGR
jgi:hypothetical protein